MFSKIPTKFTAPFGLLGDEAKLAFPSQPNGILKLSTVRNIPSTDPCWEQYFTLFDSASEVFSLITPQQIRRALTEAPENVSTLIHVVCLHLFKLITDHTFPSPQNTSVTAYATSFIKTASYSSQRNPTKEVLNCLRVLSRILPVVFEVEGESDTFESHLLWKKEEVEELDETQTDPQFVIEDEDESEDDTNTAEPGQTPKGHPRPSGKRKVLPSLGERLFKAISDLLFCCGFTLPNTVQVAHHKINYIIWEKGIGSTTPLGNNSAALDSNRTEVLRLLLVLLSRQIYIPALSLFARPSLYSVYLVQKLPRRDVLTILCSLLNTAMNSSTTDTITIGTIAGKLPYNHLVFKGEDPRITLITTCLQVLCVVLDFQSGAARDSKIDGQTVPSAKTNAFRYFIMKLHRSQDFEYLFEGIMGIMEQQTATAQNPLPGARKSLPYITETIILFWKLVELNKKFRIFVLESGKSMDLIAHLLFYCVEIKDKPQQHGVCRAISYILQTLSSEPAFGAQMTTAIKVQLPTKWGQIDTAADFIIQAVYAIVATTSGSLTSLYPALIITLSNAAPYFKNIGVSASARLIQLLTSFSNPLFLLSDEGHPRLLFFMLEVFGAVIYHHPAENPNITYSILQSRKLFEELGTFNLVRGIREVRRAQVAKEERESNSAINPKAKGVVDDLELGDAGAEKARLLHNEGATRPDAQESNQDSDSTRTSEEVLTAAVMSPSSDNPYDSPASPVSEKARGKMKERRSLSVETVSPLDRVPLNIGRNGFVPTQEWVTSWQQGLPLDPIMIFISEVVQRVEDLQRQNTVPSAESLRFLSSVHLDHVLPNKPPITSRRFLWSDSSLVWLTSLIWGEIYVRGMAPLGIWNATNVRLFFVKHSQNQTRQITNTVNNVVGGIGGFLRRS